MQFLVPLHHNSSIGYWVEQLRSPYAVDLSDRLPESMRQLGWKVVKVVVPQYQPLNLTEEMEDFALIRLNNAEFRLGVEAAIPSQQIFQHPHPFL
jgi:hypothetical protein